MALLKGTSLRGSISPRASLILTPNVEGTGGLRNGRFFTCFLGRTDQLRLRSPEAVQSTFFTVLSLGCFRFQVLGRWGFLVEGSVGFRGCFTATARGSKKGWLLFSRYSGCEWV